MSKPRPDLWRVAVTVPEHALDAFDAALEPHADTVSMMLPEGKDPGEGADWRMEAVSRSPFDQTAVEVALGLAAAAVGLAPPVAEF